MNLLFFIFCFIQFTILSFDIKIFNNSDKYVEVQFFINSWCCHKLKHSIFITARNNSWKKYKSDQNMTARILIDDIPEKDYLIKKNKKYKLVISNDNILVNSEN